MSIPEYTEWKKEPSPENLAKVVTALDPTINAEIQRYSGPKPLLRSKAKLLAVNAVRTYDPNRGAHIRSWLVTQLQPLSRYGQQLRPVHASEMAIRQAAELNRLEKEYGDMHGRNPTLPELADEVGIPVARIQKIRKQVKPVISESAFMEADDEEGKSMP
jgi:DNA-directed RNA polymerase specialized sigma subunit